MGGPGTAQHSLCHQCYLMHLRSAQCAPSAYPQCAFCVRGCDLGLHARGEQRRASLAHSKTPLRPARRSRRCAHPLRRSCSSWRSPPRRLCRACTLWATISSMEPAKACCFMYVCHLIQQHSYNFAHALLRFGALTARAPRDECFRALEPVASWRCLPKDIHTRDVPITSELITLSRASTMPARSTCAARIEASSRVCFCNNCISSAYVFARSY